MAEKTSMKGWWQEVKNVYHYFQAYAWRWIYGRPDRGMKIYGVTGTNGKTTTAIILASILREEFGQEKVGLLSTEVVWFGSQEKTNLTHMTSIDAHIVFSYLKRMAGMGVEHLVLEMTSHALDQHRLAGIKLNGAMLLNIKHEHLDYHRTMEEYARAKKKIINYLVPGGVVVANHDDELVRMTLISLKNVKWFTGAEAAGVATPLLGDFNKENVLAASLLAKEVGIKGETIVRGVQKIRQIPGRVEWMDMPNGARVVIDFALTPYSYERLFKFLREATTGELIVVFGAAGRRDKKKRPIMSKIVSQYADEIVLTQDEPYDDPEEEIYAQLEEGLLDATIPWRRVEDRREAMRYAIKKAQAGDVVAILGMGNYNVRMVGDKKIPWNDKKVVLEILKEVG